MDGTLLLFQIKHHTTRLAHGLTLAFICILLVAIIKYTCVRIARVRLTDQSEDGDQSEDADSSAYG